jgi:hypothetical protein
MAAAKIKLASSSLFGSLSLVLVHHLVQFHKPFLMMECAVDVDHFLTTAITQPTPTTVQPATSCPYFTTTRIDQTDPDLK